MHSKTSGEVLKIYDAIRFLECQLFMDKKRESGERYIADVNEKIEKGRRKLVGLARAPEDMQQEHQAGLKALEKRAIELTKELQFIESCIGSVADRERARELRAECRPPSASRCKPPLGWLHLIDLILVHQEQEEYRRMQSSYTASWH